MKIRVQYEAKVSAIASKTLIEAPNENKRIVNVWQGILCKCGILYKGVQHRD